MILTVITLLTGCSTVNNDSTKNQQIPIKTEKNTEPQTIEKEVIKENEEKSTDVVLNKKVESKNTELEQHNINVEWGKYYKSTYNMKDDWMMDINITNIKKNIIAYKLEVTPNRGYDFITDLGRIQGNDSDTTWDRVYHYYNGNSAKFGNYQLTLYIYDCEKLPKNIQDEICIMSYVDLEEIFEKYEKENNPILPTSNYTKFYNIFSLEEPPVEISEKQYTENIKKSNVDNKENDELSDNKNTKTYFNSIVFDKEDYFVGDEARANFNIKNTGESFEGLILIKMNREGFSSSWNGEYIYSNYYKSEIKDGISLNKPVAFSFSDRGTSWPSETSIFEDQGVHKYEFSLYRCDEIKKEFNKECDEVDFGNDTFDDGLPKTIPLDVMSISIEVK